MILVIRPLLLLFCEQVQKLSIPFSKFQFWNHVKMWNHQKIEYFQFLGEAKNTNDSDIKIIQDLNRIRYFFLAMVLS